MSRFPPEAFSLRGSCSCSAIRYTLNFPPEADRPIALPADKSNGQGTVRLPQTAVCFCSDCRQSSGNLILFVILVPFSQAALSLERKKETTGRGKTEGLGADEGSVGRLECGAAEHFPPKEEIEVGETWTLDGTFLSAYRSSEKAMRAFCSVRCECSYWLLCRARHSQGVWHEVQEDRVALV